LSTRSSEACKGTSNRRAQEGPPDRLRQEKGTRPSQKKKINRARSVKKPATTMRKKRKAEREGGWLKI